MAYFDRKDASTYHDGPPRQVPGYAGLMRMASLLLAERIAEQGRVLVLGAGGGMEIRTMAEDHAGWSFDGVDPSASMLALAAETTSAFAGRVQLHQGYIDTAPPGPFDGATCILTMHFVPRADRLDTLTQIRRRLAPGAPFVMAHISFPQAEPERAQWIARHVAFGAQQGLTQDQLASAREAIATRLAILDPAEEVDLLEKAGFEAVTPFYAALSFRGWVAYAGARS
jgi:tRNA (cmo5U34)-methyltransferase